MIIRGLVGTFGALILAYLAIAFVIYDLHWLNDLATWRGDERFFFLFGAIIVGGFGGFAGATLFKELDLRPRF